MARPADNNPPLYISQATRHDGVVSLVIPGHSLTSADVNRQITVVFPSRPDINGVFTISQVVLPDTVRFKQSASLPSFDIALGGGACSVNT